MIEPILRSITVRRSPDEAFRLFTAEMGSWWPLDTHGRADEYDGVKTERLVFEEREGGRIYEVLSNGIEADWGVVTAWEPPSRVMIDLSMSRGVLSLEVSDNGRGLSQEDLAKARSFGIRGLHERAGTVGGWVDLRSGPGGTTLILSVPLGSDDEVDMDPTVPGAPLEEPSSPYDPTVWGAL